MITFANLKDSNMEEKLYPGYTSQDIVDFCGDSLKSIPRDGVPVSGSFLTTASGESHLLGKGDLIMKNDKGEISVKDVYGKIK